MSAYRTPLLSFPVYPLAAAIVRRPARFNILPLPLVLAAALAATAGVPPMLTAMPRMVNHSSRSSAARVPRHVRRWGEPQDAGSMGMHCTHVHGPFAGAVLGIACWHRRSLVLLYSYGCDCYYLVLRIGAIMVHCMHVQFSAVLACNAISLPYYCIPPSCRPPVCRPCGYVLPIHRDQHAQQFPVGCACLLALLVPRVPLLPRPAEPQARLPRTLSPY